MSQDKSNLFLSPDPTADSRKKDHIELAMKAIVESDELDKRFYYEPLLSGHPKNLENLKLNFLDKNFGAPLWISSMTGGTQKATIINENLARACGEFNLGMGLGSCRQLLEDDTYLKDFSVRRWMPHQPLYANLGVAQLEQLIHNKKLFLVKNLIEKLEADGLIIHVNPMQEWLQPEGDRFNLSSLEIIKIVIESADYNIIVKEVGQGMGPNSMLELLKLPIQALDFAAAGGTNFALLELLRAQKMQAETYECLAHIGHDAPSMVGYLNTIIEQYPNDIKCKQIIISGGIKSFLDGYYLTQKCSLNAVYGQASAMLKHAQVSYESLQNFIQLQLQGLSIAQAFLKIKN